MSDIILDPAIRDWVVLPMVLIMILMGIGRHYLSKILRSPPVAKIEDTKNMQTLQRAQKLRFNGKFLTPTAFTMRKRYHTAQKGEWKDGGRGVLRRKVKGGPPNPMANPNQMTDMLKGNMSFMLPNIAMMGLISMFFSGFVLVKVPFPLTQSFKSMLQRGIELQTLDASYVSSLSWYFLVMFGMRGFLSLILGEATDSDEERMMQMQMGMGGAGPGQNFDPAKAFQQERDSLELMRHKWAMTKSEARLLGDKVSEEDSVMESNLLQGVPHSASSRSKFSKASAGKKRR